MINGNSIIGREKIDKVFGEHKEHIRYDNGKTT